MKRKTKPEFNPGARALIVVCRMAAGVVVIGGTLSAGSMTHAQENRAPATQPNATATGARPLDVLQKKISVPAENLNGTTEEALFAFAQASKINFLMDATPREAEEASAAARKAAKSSDAKQQPTNAKALLDQMTKDRKLTWRLQDNQLLLMWPEPDIIEKARVLAAVTADGSTQAVAGAAADAALARAVMEYVEGNGESGSIETTRSGKSRRIPLKLLPPVLQSRLIEGTRAEMLKPSLIGNWKAWLQNDFWENAFVQMRDFETLQAGQTLTDPPTKKQVQLLMIGGLVQSENGSNRSMMSISRIE